MEGPRIESLGNSIWENVSPGLFINRQVLSQGKDLFSREFLVYLNGLGGGKGLPSGIPGFSLYPSDHVLFYLESTDKSYMDYLIDFVIAGIENPLQKEVCTLETGFGWDKKSLAYYFEKRSNFEFNKKADIIPWEQGYLPYLSETDSGKIIFQKSTMKHSFFDDMYKLRQKKGSLKNASVRIASEDSGYFLTSLYNPRDYLIYEMQLLNDLEEAFKSKAVQLCVYSQKDVMDTSHKENVIDKLSLSEILVRLISSHNRHIVRTINKNLLFDNKAKNYLLKKVKLFELPWKLIPAYAKLRLLSQR